MEIKIYNKDGSLICETAPGKQKTNLFESCKITQKLLDDSQGLLKVRCSVPILDMHGYWTPDITRPKMKLDWKINLSSAANCNFPYICFINQGQQNRFTFASTNLLDDSILSAKMNQETGNYDMELTVSVCGDTEEFEIFTDISKRTWTEILPDYRKAAGTAAASYPEQAWYPVYCTWYAVHAAFGIQWLEQQSDTASKLGFGTFIVDDGWCFDDIKRVKPDTIKVWYEQIGDWKTSEKKLPGFGEHIRRARAGGLKYMLWVAPFMTGIRSTFYKEAKCGYLTDEHEGYRMFDISDKKAAKKIQDKLSGLVNKYGLDGLKIDFIDAIKPSIEKPVGRTSYNFIKGLLNNIKKDRPSALFEFRQRYATPIMLNHATQFRAGDVPFDFSANLHRIAQIRICLGDKVPVHADPAYWHPEESEKNVSRHMMSSIAGVPMISMDLNKLSAKHREIMKNWIEFYRSHLETFKNGRWLIKYHFDSISYISVTSKTEKILFLCGEHFIDLATGDFQGTLYLLNLGNRPVAFKNCLSFDPCGRPSTKGTIPVAGHGIAKEC